MNEAKRSPHSGDEPDNGQKYICHEAFPAHAGMNRASLCELSHCAAFPAHAGMNRFAAGLIEKHPLNAFPAHAGMNRIYEGVEGDVQQEPRRSPHTRG